MNISMHAYYKDAVKMYKSRSQLARVVTENWCRDNMYCPFCNNTSVKPFENNKKVYDFFCDNCGQQYQLKSKLSNIGKSISDLLLYRGVSEEDIKEKSQRFIAYAYALKHISKL